MKTHMPASGRFLRPINRRLLLKAAAALTGVAAAGRVPAALAAMFDDVKDQYLNAGVDWRQAEGSSIQLAGLTHPWMETIRPLVPIFEELTGVTVEVLEQSNTEFIAEMPVKLAAENSSPDVYMVWAQGQAISGGWLEPLTPYLADSSLHDAAWWDDDDNFPGARSFAVWSDGESYTRTITAEAQTLFVNRSILEAERDVHPRHLRRPENDGGGDQQRRRFRHRHEREGDRRCRRMAGRRLRVLLRRGHSGP